MIIYHITCLPAAECSIRALALHLSALSRKQHTGYELTQQCRQRSRRSWLPDPPDNICQQL